MSKKSFLYKVVAFINRQELDFLDEMSKDIYFSTGKKVPRTEIIKEIISISRKNDGFSKEVISDLKEKGGENA